LSSFALPSLPSSLPLSLRVFRAAAIVSPTVVRAARAAAVTAVQGAVTAVQGAVTAERGAAVAARAGGIATGWEEAGGKATEAEVGVKQLEM